MNIILHIGAGKTGTTSIQQALEIENKALKSQGFKYLGLMLENCYNKKFSWQKKNQDFHQVMLQNDKIEEEIYATLINTSLIVKEEGIHTMIWSNESILMRPDQTMNVMQRLERNGFVVKVLMYVRDYAKWQKSAYLQWGLKHKTYKGKLLSFNEWSKNIKADFYKRLEKVMYYGLPITIRNMENKDAVLDFFKTCDIDINYKENRRDNIALNNEELFLRSLFNNKFNDVVFPHKFDEIIQLSSKFSHTPQEYMEELLPSKNDLLKIYEESIEDRKNINKLLSSQHQELLVDNVIKENNTEINLEILVKSLSDLVISNAIKINELTEKINELNTK